jgi:hypothetical protein
VQEPGFVGRTRELADLDRRLAAARSGQGSLVLVEGEAGAGKTAQAQALVARVRGTGVQVAWGGCLEGEGAAPYRPWVQLAGIAVIREGRWTGWARYVVLACGLAVFVLVIPGLMMSMVAGRLVLVTWMLIWAALGVALIRAARLRP